VTDHPGHACDAAWRTQWQAAEFYVGDRTTAKTTASSGGVERGGLLLCAAVRQEALFTVLEEFPLTPADRAPASLRWLVRSAAVQHEPCAWCACNRGRRTPAGDQVQRGRRNGGRAGRVDLLLPLAHPSSFFNGLNASWAAATGWPNPRKEWRCQSTCAPHRRLLLMRYTGQRPGKRAMEMIRFLPGRDGDLETHAPLGLEKNGTKAPGPFFCAAPSAQRGASPSTHRKTPFAPVPTTSH